VGEGSASGPGSTLPPGKTWNPFYSRLGGPQGRSGLVREISSPPGLDPRNVRPVGSRYTMCTGSLEGVKRPGRGIDHPHPYSVEVKERVELYLYSTSVPSWPVIGRSLPLPLHIQSCSLSRSYSSTAGTLEARSSCLSLLYKYRYILQLIDNAEMTTPLGD